MRTEEEGIPQWDVEEMKKVLKDEETVIVDIREPDEYEEAHSRCAASANVGSS
ncbi:rhodanese-like domain-containing protein [Geomicrobium sp. JCM 19039]|uniref:rhodanese-like domain-containing protein n=1 Tax=Geomicrobium sp. JCM 19039 TaxID=1460636 RepID=UPI00045F44F3|nr:rhodanese-like domain-containing protein [Geomicrobium sp. JCM 19039]GAK11803.1 hypothetical protein JCM19039_1520 [Geomicrobium sp. JCM 19039]